MIQLFYSAIFGEMVVILILLFNNPLRKLVVMALNRLKQGAGPLIAKTVAGVVFVMMSTTVYNIIEIHGRPVETINPTDQILHGIKTLEATKKQSLDDVKSGSSDKLKVLGDEISSLKAKIKQLESECESNGKEVKAAEANE
ncbi:hypothetical protein Vadar_005101 [Vaccinium darrowii]|uniref:Uncharacterized protein n=1 Tax=Vaccinium darrowii TaxID=229202 RepID=A0ACB7Z2M5_9ERIC|nr:hypothetical protein Vadar_005101 [Vaccinium darrowii]